MMRSQSTIVSPSRTETDLPWPWGRTVPIVKPATIPPIDSLHVVKPTDFLTHFASSDHHGEEHRDIYNTLAYGWGNLQVANEYRVTGNGKVLEDRDIGIDASQALGGGVDVYSGFNNYSFDTGDSGIDGMNAFHIGSPLRFSG